MTRSNVDNRKPKTWALRAMIASCLLLVWSVPILAQSSDDKKSDGTPATAVTHPNNPELWDTQAMMNQAVDQISRRYNLNDQQKEYTRLLLVSRVTAFLDEHEMEVRQLLQESIEMRTGQRPADAVALQVWANRALPLYAEASKAILEGNEEWSVILDEDQKAIHDRDMALMQRSFKNATTTMNTWQEGKGKLPSVAKQPANQNASAVNANSNDAAKTSGAVSRDPKPANVIKLEDNWLAYVNAFINTYSLEGKDEVSARDKILKEMYGKARKYRELNSRQFTKLADQQKDSAKNKKIRIHDVLNQKKQLELPIREMFVQLDKRLRRLPTAEQFANADADQKKKLEEYYKALAGDAGPDAKATAGKAGPDKAAEALKTEDATKDAEPAKKAEADKQEVAKPNKGKADDKSDSDKPVTDKPATDTPSEDQSKEKDEKKPDDVATA